MLLERRKFEQAQHTLELRTAEPLELRKLAAHTVEPRRPARRPAQHTAEVAHTAGNLQLEQRRFVPVELRKFAVRTAAGNPPVGLRKR